MTGGHLFWLNHAGTRRKQTWPPVFSHSRHTHIVRHTHTSGLLYLEESFGSQLVQTRHIASGYKNKAIMAIPWISCSGPCSILNAFELATLSFQSLHRIFPAEADPNLKLRRAMGSILWQQHKPLARARGVLRPSS